MRYASPYGSVTLTAERKRHILTFHPDIADCLHHFAKTLAKPEHIAASRHDKTVCILYRCLPKRRRHLAVVIKTGKKPFVLTAYLAKKLKSDTL